ncbi:uncharacterized protein LOC119066028 [Bradysia coprophila]|uniref:uncharacterized protein LOC119066028 n=1 Tax=Bradysia coprophila TaxID=38358 RepID=UPI00187DBC03|nr:uncharacterized protein LOC119066028 [Bradysia coprophila]
MPLFGYQNPISSYQSAYNNQQASTSSAMNAISQNNVFHPPPIPNINNPQPNPGTSMNVLPGNGVNLLAPSNSSNNPNRRLTAEQIAARQTAKELPHFHGSVDEWPIFISSYENANALCGYNNQENLNRLITCLKGDARETVKNLLVHADAVPEIIRTLFVLYGMPERVIESMIEELKKEPAPKDKDLESIMKYGFKSHHGKVTSPASAPVGLYEKNSWSSGSLEAASLVVRPTVKTNPRKPQQKDANSTNSSAKNGNFINTQVESTSKVSSSQANKVKKCPACKEESCTKLTSCKKFKGSNRNERLAIVKENKLCTRCLGGHHFYRCRSNFKCKVDSCTAKHHTMLHDNEKSNESPSKDDTPTSNGNKTTKSVAKFSSNASHSNSMTSLKQRVDKFRIVPIIVTYNGRSVNDFAFLDCGSNMTSMETSLANELNVNGTSSPICVDWAFGHRHTFDSKIVSVTISGCFDKADKFKLNNVRTVDELHLPQQTITSSWLKQFNHLNGIPIATYESAKPRMLIGLQYSRLMVSLKTVEGQADQPIASKTRLGWVIQGPSYKGGENSNRQFSMNICECQVDDNNLHQLVKDYFQSENLGVSIPNTLMESKENQRAREIMESTTSKRNGRYETGLLWKYDQIELPNSYPMALKRLQCLESKMSKDPKLAENLRTQMQQFVDKKYIRKLTAEELQSTNESRIWYLPTFPAFNPKKPEKVRIVWDGAAKVMKVSLNSLLLTGPDQLVPLPDILRKFRERLYAFIGDIKEMYHQIRVIEADQNVQRFLWRDGDQTREPDIYVMMVLTFGLTCSPSQAQYVKNRNAFDFIKEYPEAVYTIIHKHYVDDMLDSEHTIDAAEKRIREVKFIHKEGGFEIRNFLSNSKELLRRIGETGEQSTKNMNISFELGTERVLGMFWNTGTDCFTFSLKYTKVNEQILSGKHHPTKREVLRVLMSVFDPLGLLAHYLIHTKILLQEIWRTKVNWDEQITQPNFKKWTEWIKTLHEVENIQIPRLYSPKLSPNEPKSIQIHTFVDASCEAYATAVYLRIEDESGVDCCLVNAKTKVAPNKPMSVPRLELQGAVLGTRLTNSVKSSQTFKIDKVVYWTDSLTVMGWINSEARRYNQFVAFRIGEVLESSESNQWRWVPSEHNVADEATKSKEIAKLDSTARWYKAPEFLYDDEDTWFSDEIEHSTEEEIRPSFVMTLREVALEELIDLSRFSQWNRLVRTQAFILRFIDNVRAIRSDRRLGPLQQDEIKRAENYLYRRAQRDTFHDEIIVMRHNQQNSLQWNGLVRTVALVLRFINNVRQKRNNRRVGPLKPIEIRSAEKRLYRRTQIDPFVEEIISTRYNQGNSLKTYRDFNRSSTLRAYSPYLDEYDVIRMKGRIDAADAVSYETKRPIILPRRHRITQLVVDHYHRRYKHCNHATALNEIRQKFVIPALRVVMKGIRTSCQKCKNSLAKPKIPEMAELPPGRLAVYILPFTYVGVDYFGPIRVRNGRKTRNRPVIMEKRWVLLFTCLTTRAIWMEIAHSMDTSLCIMCIDNFMLRKGRPREVFSDNGLSFHSSEKELSDEFAKVDQREIEEKFTNSEMVWKFNPPATPHMGGVWERLIRTVKTCLKETLRTRTPNDEMLKNLIVEAEFIVNSRPLTYVSLETADDEALTPNHILLGSSNGIKPLSNINERDLARNTYKAVQVLANNFWHRFVLEYLPTLTRRTKWFKPAEPIKVGDVVVVVDEKSQRNSWPKGIVEELLPGKKGIIRQVMIRTDRGIRKRSVSKLAVLDVKPPQPEVVNQESMGSINGEGNVAQRHLNVNNNISSKNSTTTLPDSTDE